jgi:hypothetical protein
MCIVKTLPLFPENCVTILIYYFLFFHRQLGEDSDSDFRDSSSDGSSDCEPVRGYWEQRNLPHLSDEVSHWMGRLSVRNQHALPQDGFSSDDGESVNSQGYLLFEYLERDPPYGREPLADKVCLFMTLPCHILAFPISFTGIEFRLCVISISLFSF